MSIENSQSKNSKLTLKQSKLLAIIKEFWQTNNFYPSTRDLTKILKINSSNTVFSHLKALETKGYLKKNNKGQIQQISENPFQFDQENLFKISIPFFAESIPAGFQAPAEDTAQEMITVDEYLIKNPQNTFALKVKGNSMEKAGIMTGDLLLVERNSQAKNNQIIIAHLEDGFTVKRYIEQNGEKYLKAESSQNYQIKLTEGTEIWGIVIGVVRKY